jgi:hypothetical protein
VKKLSDILCDVLVRMGGEQDGISDVDEPSKADGVYKCTYDVSIPLMGNILPLKVCGENNIEDNTIVWTVSGKDNGFSQKGDILADLFASAVQYTSDTLVTIK